MTHSNLSPADILGINERDERTTRRRLIDALWAGSDPFADFAAEKVVSDPQGWTSNHRFLSEAVAQSQPSVIVEVGAWKGMSVISLARALRDNGIDGVVVAVDTWLGSVEHWLNPEWRSALGLREGYPTLQRTFMKNVVDAGLEGYVLPLPLDSLNAAALLRATHIVPNLIHIDAGHGFDAVTSDLVAWWPLLARGGILIGDDFHPDAAPDQGWPGVRRAFNTYFATLDMLPIEHEGGKCRIVKR